MFGVVRAEFERAVAAQQRYADLQRADPKALARDGIAPAGIPWIIFEEFYVSTMEPRSGAASKIDDL